MGQRIQSTDGVAGGNLLVLTYDLAMAASWDAGNASARRAGRSAWSEEDRDAAADEFHRLCDACCIPMNQRSAFTWPSPAA